MESGEIIYGKANVSPPPRPTISFTDNWMKELDSKVAGSSQDTQRIQPKPKTQLSCTVRPVGGQESTKEIEKKYLVWLRGHQALNKNEETRGWIKIHPTLRVDAFKNCRRRSNKNGETRGWTRVHRWRSSTLTSEYQHCHMQLRKKLEISEFKELVKNRKSSSSRSTSSRFAEE